MAEVLLLSGPPASGKTTLARLISERYDRVAHIDVDLIRRLRSAGLVAPWRAEPELTRQRHLASLNAAGLARNFIASGVGVIIKDIILPDSMQWYVDELQASGVRIHLVRFLPSLQDCNARNRARREERVRPVWLTKVYEFFVAAGDFGGVSIDSTDQSPLETADSIQALTTQGASVIWPLAS